MCAPTWKSPPRAIPPGRMIIATPDRILYYGTLPLDEYPLVMLRCKTVAGMFFGRSVIEDLIPLQRAYNGVKNKIHDYIRTLALNPLLVPEGAIEDMEELAQNGVAPGDIVEYNPDRGEPKPLAGADFPAGVFEECENLAHEMEYTAGLSHLGATGNQSSAMTSASAIERLREIDGVRLALTADLIRAAVLRAAKIWLKLYKTHGSFAHTERLAGANDRSALLVWCGEDINSYDIVFESENTLLHSDESQLEAIRSGIALGLFEDEAGKIPRSVKKKLLCRMHIGDFVRTLYEDDLQSAAARRENGELLAGVRVATGACDDHEIHLAEHRRAALEYSYSKMKRSDPVRAQGAGGSYRRTCKNLQGEQRQWKIMNFRRWILIRSPLCPRTSARPRSRRMRRRCAPMPRTPAKPRKRRNSGARVTRRQNTKWRRTRRTRVLAAGWKRSSVFLRRRLRSARCPTRKSSAWRIISTGACGERGTDRRAAARSGTPVAGGASGDRGVARGFD